MEWGQEEREGGNMHVFRRVQAQSRWVWAHRRWGLQQGSWPSENSGEREGKHGHARQQKEGHRRAGKLGKGAVPVSPGCLMTCLSVGSGCCPCLCSFIQECHDHFRILFYFSTRIEYALYTRSVQAAAKEGSRELRLDHPACRSPCP